MAINIQDKVGLTCDNVPTANSQNAVKSGGVKAALDAKQDTLTFDNAPTANSNNPVKSSGIKTALDGKQDAGDYAVNGVSAAIRAFTSKTGLEKPAVSGTVENGIDLIGIDSDGKQWYARMLHDRKNIQLTHYDGTSWTTDATFSADEDTGWQTLEVSSATSGNIKYRRKNGVVYVKFVGLSMTPPTAWQVVATLPAGFRPDQRTIAEIYFGSYGSAHVDIGANGSIGIAKDASNTATSGSFWGDVSFPV